MPVDVGLSDEQGFPHRGTIEYVAPALDPATGTLLVRGILPNPDRLILPGFFVRMRLPMGKVDRNALLVPDRALQTDQGGTYLLVARQQRRGAAALRPARVADGGAARRHLGPDAGGPGRRRRFVAGDAGD